MTDKLRCDDCGAVVQLYKSDTTGLTVQCECRADLVDATEPLPEQWL